MPSYAAETRQARKETSPSAEKEASIRFCAKSRLPSDRRAVSNILSPLMFVRSSTHSCFGGLGRRDKRQDGAHEQGELHDSIEGKIGGGD